MRNELIAYYFEKNYQDPKVHYQKSYSDEEVKFFLNKPKVALRTIRQKNASTKNFFEIGCGEGFFAYYPYSDNITDIELYDFFDFGLKRFYPYLLKFLKKLEVYQHIEEAINKNKNFDIMSIDNVLGC